MFNHGINLSQLPTCFKFYYYLFCPHFLLFGYRSKYTDAYQYHATSYAWDDFIIKLTFWTYCKWIEIIFLVIWRLVWRLRFAHIKKGPDCNVFDFPFRYKDYKSVCILTLQSLLSSAYSYSVRLYWITRN